MEITDVFVCHKTPPHPVYRGVQSVDGACPACRDADECHRLVEAAADAYVRYFTLYGHSPDSVAKPRPLPGETYGRHACDDDGPEHGFRAP